MLLLIISTFVSCLLFYTSINYSCNYHVGVKIVMMMMMMTNHQCIASAVRFYDSLMNVYVLASSCYGLNATEPIK